VNLDPPAKFKSIWLVDFEFRALPGERPAPICLVAHEIHSGKTIRIWENELRSMKSPPYGLGADSLFVAYYAAAELGCHAAMAWPFPTNILDLYVEFRNITNGNPPISGNGLLGALVHFGIGGGPGAGKSKFRGLAMRGGPWTNEESEALLDYCESDVLALSKLLPKMLGKIDLPRALLRGKYIGAVANMEHFGVPLDMPRLDTLKRYWDDIRLKLIERFDPRYGIYDGLTFKRDRFVKWLSKCSIPWPLLDSGVIDLKDETFKEMALTYPEIEPISILRDTLSKMKLNKLAVGQDGRNRVMLSPFSSKTSRNQPSTSKFIFGQPKWLRSLIKPSPGYGLAYIDWCQQEVGIAAALSKDPMMIDAYQSGDPYLKFGQQAGGIPFGATKATHPIEREQYKACVLAVQYGMGKESLAKRIRQPVFMAKELLNTHKQTYPKFWQWSDAVLDFASLNGCLPTTFGWQIQIPDGTRSPSIRNFPMQANGAEMLRMACCYAMGKGIRICAPIHDALLIESKLETLEDDIKTTQACMAKASGIILGGFHLRTDFQVVEYPERYQDEKGGDMWNAVWEIIGEIENGKVA